MRDGKENKVKNNEVKGNSPMVEGDKSHKSPKERLMSAFSEILIYAVIFLLCLFLVPEFLCCKYTVEGISMQDTLNEGEQLIGEKISYRFSEPKRFDVVIIQPYKEEKKNYYVKRVIGLPGETIEIKGNSIFIDGEVLNDSKYIREPMWETTSYGPVTLEENQYFVMGDNRNYSMDSRETDIGPVPKDRIIAKVFLRVWPLKKISTIGS